MADIQIKIKNLPQIRKAFGMAPRLMRNNLNRAIRKSFVIIERSSRINTPVDTGLLRSSHRTLFRDLYGELSTNTTYDLFVHDGTRYMRARPYMRKAAESNQVNVDKFMFKAVDDTLDKIGKMT